MEEAWMKELAGCCEALGCRWEAGEPLEKHTTFRAGGPAELLAHVQTGEQCAALLKAAEGLDIPVHILGKGSNLLVADEGVKGLVLHMEPKKEPFCRHENEIRAWAGEPVGAVSFCSGAGTKRTGICLRYSRFGGRSGLYERRRLWR